MNNFLLDVALDLKAGVTVVLESVQHVHLVNVLKSKEGDVVKVGFVGKSVWLARVDSINPSLQQSFLTLQQKRACPPRPVHSIAIALPRPKAIRRVVESVSTLGVKKLTFFNAWRVEKSYWQSAKTELKNLLGYAEDGLRQGGHPWLPQIHLKRFFSDFLNESDLKHRRVVLTPSAKVSVLDELQHNCNEPREYILGPEGGFIENELEGFKKLKVSLCSLNMPILKTETAATAVLTLSYNHKSK